MSSEHPRPLVWQLRKSLMQYMPLFIGLFSAEKEEIAVWPTNADFTSTPERVLQNKSSIESVREATIIRWIHFLYCAWRLWQLRDLNCTDEQKGEQKIPRLGLFFKVLPLPLCDGCLAFWILDTWWFHSHSDDLFVLHPTYFPKKKWCSILWFRTCFSNLTNQVFR